MVIRDRGNIKWSSLMLTEHRDKLKEIMKNDSDIEKPVLDKQQLEMMNNILRKAVAEDKSVSVFYYDSKSICKYQGKIMEIDKINKELKLVTKSDTKKHLNIKNIVNLTIS
ncbi:MAG: YolD-like family protein [Halothermotrichaceae bacterium]